MFVERLGPIDQRTFFGRPPAGDFNSPSPSAEDVPVREEARGLASGPEKRVK
jgi:hypothetical protein